MILNDFLTNIPPHLTQALRACLPPPTQPPVRLHQALHYMVENGGKRLRPLLVYATGLGLGASLQSLDAPACALELIHTYSLIHDDLPAMDNDDFRRGQPSCHKAFNEATAILAGDALQALAFETLAQATALSPQQRCDMITTITQAAGTFGMVGGQTLDLEATKSSGKAALEKIHRDKTGALIRASIQCGAIAANLDDPTLRDHLDRFAECLGLAYQIQDDLLDFDTETNDGKSSFAHLLGIEAAKQEVIRLHAEGLKHLQQGGPATSLLGSLGLYILPVINPAF